MLAKEHSLLPYIPIFIKIFLGFIKFKVKNFPFLPFIVHFEILLLSRDSYNL